ncbi:MAG TPA: CYTH and CHAD domain-containing protein [Acidimicrobiales bacterium]|nr:CYTH and CHAD domain-containing protein [Acidimicrobiales bacterium]
MTPLASSLEQEAKFETEVGGGLPDLRTVVGGVVRLPGQSLRTAYFDTADFRLWQRRLTLRHRLGEETDTGTWTLKLPEAPGGAVLSRTELTWPGPREPVPDEVTRVLKGVVRRSPLVPIAELASERVRFGLFDAKGRPLGEIDDDTVTVVGGRRDGFRFREVEVEFEGAPARVVEGVLRKFRKAGARSGREPKLARALDLPPPGRRKALGPKALLGEVVQASLADALDRILDHDYRLRVDPSDLQPEDVHQARVATRRLRSDLKSFGSILDPVWLGHTRAELKWLGERLGRVRDRDVLAGHLERDLGTGAAAGASELLAGLFKQRRQAARELDEALESDRYLTLLDRLDAGSQLPPFYPVAAGQEPSRSRHRKRSRHPHPDDRARAAVPALVGSRWRGLRKRVRQAGRHPSDTELHRIRIGAKQLRYAAEAATPVVGRSAARTARRAERLQTVLGDHHDAVTAEAWLREQAAQGTRAASFAAGILAAGQIRRQRQLRRRWRATWRSLDQSKARAWLG